MKITKGLYLVASGATGFDVSHALDCNVFLVSDGAEHHLFDAGAGVEPGAIVAALGQDGLDPAGLKTLFLTHGHADHSGGAAALARMIPDLRIVAGARTASILAANDERLISLDRARGRVYPLDYCWSAPTVGYAATAGETVRTSSFDVRLVPTPGHSDDHVSWLVEGAELRAFVAGDALFADGRIILQDIEDCSVSRSLESIRTMAGLDFDAFLPGHGRFSLRDGKRHVEAAMRFADAGLPPPQI